MSINYMGMGQNPIPLVNIKIAGKWMFIPLKMVCIGIDPYPYKLGVSLIFRENLTGCETPGPEACRPHAGKLHQHKTLEPKDGQEPEKVWKMRSFFNPIEKLDLSWSGGFSWACSITLEFVEYVFSFLCWFFFSFFQGFTTVSTMSETSTNQKKTICLNTSKSLLPDKSWGTLKYNLHPYFLAGDALACDCRKCQGNPFTSLKVWLGMIASNSHLRSNVIVSVLQPYWCWVGNVRELSIALFIIIPFPIPYVSLRTKHNSHQSWKNSACQGDDLPILAADKGEDCRNWSTFAVTIWCWGLGPKDCVNSKKIGSSPMKMRG